MEGAWREEPWREIHNLNGAECHVAGGEVVPQGGVGARGCVCVPLGCALPRSPSRFAAGLGSSRLAPPKGPGPHQ